MAAGIIFALSVGAVFLFHYFQMTAIARLAGVPAILSLVGALFQLGRDSLAFDRSLRLELTKNSFSVGATSHMAKIAFDKHVAFCEDYIAEVFRSLHELFRTGPHQDALIHAQSLYAVRRKHAVWLTRELELELEHFESKIRTIGAAAHLVNAMPGDPEGVETMFSEFANVFGAKYGFREWDGKAISEEYTIETIVAHLRNVLGIDELTKLRIEFVKRATRDSPGPG